MSLIMASAADARFFDWVQGMIQSVRDKPQGQSVSIALFDLGCSDDQRQWLRQHVDFVCEPQWDFSFPPTAKIPDHFRGFLVKPFLRRYFPGFDTYMWIDADTWVQDWSAIDLYERGAQNRGLAVVPEFARGNSPRYGQRAKLLKDLSDWYGSHFGSVIGGQLASYPMLNTGVFSLRADAPHWEPWEECMRSGLKVSCSNLADQLAMNLVVYQRGLLERTELLPAWCNWTCHDGLPAWDAERRLLVEPYLPHTPIGVLHLSGEKLREAVLPTTDGRKETVRMCYAVASASTPPEST
jgi:hypothetical protein